jgi:hypothetical protein
MEPRKQSYRKDAFELTNCNNEAISMKMTLLGEEAIESKNHVRIWARAVPSCQPAAVPLTVDFLDWVLAYLKKITMSVKKIRHNVMSVI